MVLNYLSSNAICDSNDENNLPHNLLVTNTQVSMLCKAFATGSSSNIKFSKINLSKMVQLGGFLGRLLRTLLKAGLLLIGNVLKPLAKSVFMPSELTAAAAAATNTAIQTKIFGLGITALIFSNEEMDDIMKIVKSLKESGLLIKGVIETIETEAKNKKMDFLSTLLGTLAASLLGSILTGKGAIRSGDGTSAANQGRGTIRAGHGF